MNKQLVSIGLTLENCEYITIDKKDIKSLVINRLTREINYRDNNLIDNIIAKNIIIILKKSSNENYNSYGENTTIFKRIEQHDDIVSITINYEVDEHIECEEFYVDYDGYEKNLNQWTYIDRYGHLVIKIDNSVRSRNYNE